MAKRDLTILLQTSEAGKGGFVQAKVAVRYHTPCRLLASSVRLWLANVRHQAEILDVI